MLANGLHGSFELLSAVSEGTMNSLTARVRGRPTPGVRGRPTPVEKSERRGADTIVETLLSLGVDRVFGIPGGAISGVFDALILADVDVVICQHEQMAGYLAYGYARATGRPAAVAVTAGPGVLNTLTSVAAAYQDEVPMIVLAGDVRTSAAGKGALQDGGPDGIDIINMMKKITKFSDTLQQPDRIVSVIEDAVQAAMTHPRGPAFLRIPLDTTLEPNVEVVPSLRSRQAVLTDMEPDALLCTTIAERLMRAKRPALFLGIGARVSEVGPQVLRIAERLRCPVICDVEAKGVFPESHSLSLGLFGVGGGGASAAYLENCDVLITLGARLDDTTTNGFSPLLRPANGYMVQLDHDARRLNRSYIADDTMATDLRRALTAIESQLGLPTALHALHREARVRSARESDQTSVGLVPLKAPFDPRSIISLIQAAFPENTIWTSDIGNHLLAASRYLVLDEPGTFHAAVGFGGMGSGIGVAMGMAMVHGEERPVVGICGDGSFRMVGAELATCAKYNIPVVLIVFNDARYGMVSHGMETVYGRVDYCDSPDVDIVGFATALGVRAIRVEKLSDLSDAASLVGSGPLVIELPIDPDIRIANPRNKTLAH